MKWAERTNEVLTALIVNRPNSMCCWWASQTDRKKNQTLNSGATSRDVFKNGLTRAIHKFRECSLQRAKWPLCMERKVIFGLSSNPRSALCIKQPLALYAACQLEFVLFRERQRYRRVTRISSVSDCISLVQPVHMHLLHGTLTESYPTCSCRTWKELGGCNGHRGTRKEYYRLSMSNLKFSDQSKLAWLIKR